MSRKPVPINVCDGVFDRNSPRPPVPGEERAHCYSDWGPMDYPPTKNSISTPKKHHYDTSEHDSKSLACSDQQMDTRTPDNITPPAYLRWASSLFRLLEDSDGVELFKRYLQAEGKSHADALDFWFACEGLKKQHEHDRVQQLVKVIYKRFFIKSGLPISEEQKKEVGRRVKSGVVNANRIFDEAQSQIENLIKSTTYPNFIKSDMYLQYIQSVQNPTGSSGEFSSESSSSSSSISNKDFASLGCNVGPLPVIHEDMEFVPSLTSGHLQTPGTGYVSTGYLTPNVGHSIRLTKDMLLATQRNRAMDVRPKPEVYAADMYMYRGTSHHLAYNSYNPVSRQDSEMQSLSSHSDIRTESDNMSLTDSSVDGRSLHRSKRKAAMEARQVRENAALNRESQMHQTLIPRTQRVDKQQCQSLHPDHFAAILIQKLESVKREQETQENLDRKLKESISMNSLNDKSRMNEVHSRELANAIREKLQVEDDNVQDILDEHVSRVFSRPHSPTRNRWQGAYLKPRKKDKDGFSTFSSDSGNVHDYAECSEHKMVKSKSMPEYADERDRFVRGSTSRRSSSKKTLADLTDSGVSVVSDTPPVHNMQQKDHRVLAWLKESDRGYRSVNYTLSEMSLKHRGHRSSSATSPNANRHKKGYGSRSSSLERSGASSTLGPVQPFATEPSIPPLPQYPNTAVQLEEARRRLMEDDVKIRSRQRSSSKYYPEMTQSSQSTLRKSMRSTRQSTAASEDETIAVYSFYDEQYPYRIRIPGKQVTLKKFKEYLPRKGNYRYFFKTECEELDNQVIQEEVSNDSDILPMWEGKINAQVKSID